MPKIAGMMRVSFTVRDVKPKLVFEAPYNLVESAPGSSTVRHDRHWQAPAQQGSKGEADCPEKV